ncbi:adipocyte plasma membrane-associated protein-like [Panonychus citri]|uniref:adipocyte plasma membrane-associated protein-like n=1 Tax=Panonychus citri TaxID=50023 RepID=UPI0023080AF4|nr:adipocyte plasma membrane-associated protein-like [Panonychus citri]
MGLFSFFWNLSVRLSLVSCIFLAILPNLPDDLFPSFPFDPVSYEIPATDSFFNKIKWNSLISDKSDTLIESQVVGPESIISKSSYIYTGLGDGRIVAIHKENLKVKTLVNLNDPGAGGCGDNVIINTTTCGRPLGLRFGLDGKIYFVDAVKGLFSFDLETNQLNHLSLGSKSSADYKGFYNDLVFDPKNEDIVYISVTSSRWTMDSIIWSLLEMRADGFILSVNLKNGQVNKILTGHRFYNGLEISPDKSSLLISVTGEFKILKVDLSDIEKSLETGQSVSSVQILINDLPGMPDNIRVFGNDLYIGLPLLRRNSTIIDNLSTLPKIRKIIGRLSNLIDRFLTLLHEKVYPHPKLREMSVSFRNGHILHQAIPSSSGVLIIDANTGKPKRILGSSTHPSISEALLDTSNGDLYLGSYRNNYLLKIKAKDLK